MSSPDPVISLLGVNKVYRRGSSEVHALSNVTLDIDPGGFCAITGPSGSGKSTLLNVLGCLDRPSSGHYHLDGHDVAQLDDDARSDIRLNNIGFVFQSFHLIQQLSVLENIELPLFYLADYNVGDSAKAAELAEAVGLSHRLTHRPAELSGGEQQRVAIARALINDPALILADEPTGNLDTGTGRQIMELLKKLNSEGKTIAMVTHESEIAAWASSRIQMRDGKVEESTR